MNKYNLNASELLRGSNADRIRGPSARGSHGLCFRTSNVADNTRMGKAKETAPQNQFPWAASVARLFRFGKHQLELGACQTTSSPQRNVGLSEADTSCGNTVFRFPPPIVRTHSPASFPPGHGSPEPAHYVGIKKWLSPALWTHVGVGLERFLCCIANNSFWIWAGEEGGFGTGWWHCEVHVHLCLNDLQVSLITSMRPWNHMALREYIVSALNLVSRG